MKEKKINKRKQKHMGFCTGCDSYCPITKKHLTKDGEYVYEISSDKKTQERLKDCPLDKK